MPLGRAGKYILVFMAQFAISYCQIHLHERASYSYVHSYEVCIPCRGNFPLYLFRLIIVWGELQLGIVNIHSTHYLFPEWSKAYSEFSKSVPGTSSSGRLYNNHFKVTGNYVMYDRSA